MGSHVSCQLHTFGQLDGMNLKPRSLQPVIYSPEQLGSSCLNFAGLGVCSH